VKAFTYLIYIICMMVVFYGGTGYAVFVLGADGWWFALAVPLSFCAYSPLKWIHGVDA